MSETYRYHPGRFGDHGGIEGDTPFARAVNAIIRERWVETGRDTHPLDAVITVIGRDYDERHKEEPGR